MGEAKTEKRWAKTYVNNLVRHRSGTYYARFFRDGKESWRSLRTTAFEVAKNTASGEAQELLELTTMRRLYRPLSQSAINPARLLTPKRE